MTESSSSVDPMVTESATTFIASALPAEYNAPKAGALFWTLRNVCLGAGCLPLLWLLADIALDNLGSNQQQLIHVRLGDWSLRFLCITLLITPLQKMTGWQGMAAYRQMFGLFSFFYATLHLIAYLWLDHGLVWLVITTDIAESSYIWYGLIAYVVLFLLAITSSKSAKKLLGKSWKKLHRYIYSSAIAVVIHYFWQLKGNLWQPIFYAIIIAVLLLFRVLLWLRNRQLIQAKIHEG
jgi:sulfoxide reductase heme-binding subunit YedZ